MIFETDEEQAEYNAALKRFVSKCRYDEMTGCVVWTAMAHHYRDGKPQYGGFSFRGEKWLAHRWAAIFIHGFDLSGGLTVGHCCPGWPNNRCVHHLEPQTYLKNGQESYYRNLRKQKGILTPSEKQYWMLVERGYEEPHPDAPEWLRSAQERFGLLDIKAPH